MSASSALTSSTVTTSAAATTRLNLFGNLFGDNTKNNDDQVDLQENELARFSNLAQSSSSDNTNDVKFDSLSIMISEWSQLFAHDDDGSKNKKMGLTTPVQVVPLATQSSGDVSGVQLLFQKSKVKSSSAYRDKDDEKKTDNNDTSNDNAAIKEGGIEVQVQKLSNGELQVVAKRCEIEEGTMIKEMSEQTILDSLRGAVNAWRKEQKN